MATGTTLYAWALLPNHAHLLLRSGAQGLPRFMRRLLTGYALTYNRRHKRVGHLFQNRYKSIVVEEDPYFRELVRYIHLNPVRARLVPDLPHVDRYPWCGHAGILGRTSPPWQDRAYVLSWFGRTERAALRAYRAFLREGIPQGRRPELVGGGLVRGAGYPPAGGPRRNRRAHPGQRSVRGTDAGRRRCAAADAASPGPPAAAGPGAHSPTVPAGAGRPGGAPDGEPPAPDRGGAGASGGVPRDASRALPRRDGATARGLHVGDCESGRESRAAISPLNQQRPGLRAADQILMLFVYPKPEREDLTLAQLKQLKRIVDEEYR